VAGVLVVTTGVVMIRRTVIGVLRLVTAVGVGRSYLGVRRVMMMMVQPTPRHVSEPR
jgi:hypothetical protein